MLVENSIWVTSVIPLARVFCSLPSDLVVPSQRRHHAAMLLAATHVLGAPSTIPIAVGSTSSAVMPPTGYRLLAEDLEGGLRILASDSTDPESSSDWKVFASSDCE